jgi:hypothetical protein
MCEALQIVVLYFNNISLFCSLGGDRRADRSISFRTARLDSLIIREFLRLFEKFHGKRFNLLWRVNRDGFIAKEFRIPHSAFRTNSPATSAHRLPRRAVTRLSRPGSSRAKYLPRKCARLRFWRSLEINAHSRISRDLPEERFRLPRRGRQVIGALFQRIVLALQ